jgi:hypothetical protein
VSTPSSQPPSKEIESQVAPRDPYTEPALTRLGTVSDLTEGITKGGIAADPGVGASFIPPG